MILTGLSCETNRGDETSCVDAEVSTFESDAAPEGCCCRPGTRPRGERGLFGVDWCIVRESGRDVRKSTGSVVGGRDDGSGSFAGLGVILLILFGVIVNTELSSCWVATGGPLDE